MELRRSKRGQVTIFVIVAIILVAATIIYFLARGSPSRVDLSPELSPLYNHFLSCLEEDSLLGIQILEQQGGYIEVPEFESGSSYSPFSSQLDFAGVHVPYWYYVDFAGRAKEQIPTKTMMEKDLANFVSREIENCNFDDYYAEGADIQFEGAESKVEIIDGEVIIKMDLDLKLSKANETAVVRTHEVIVSSELAGLYDSAKQIYEKEQADLFLEKYAIDILRLNAPVDGVEIGCAPEIWVANEVFVNLESSIELNTLALRKSGELIENEEDAYFAVDLETDYEVRFLNSKNWAHSFEVNPSEGNLLLAEPVGNSAGLGILGFCYVPYHFVYNVNYPVLAQVYSEEEIFQFPMAVVIKGNKEREALPAVSSGFYESEVCKYHDTLISVRTYDKNLNPVLADITYECLGESCKIGNSSEENLFFPQCVNGNLVANAEGYREQIVSLSTVDEGSMELIMDKEYELGIDLKLDSKDYNLNAMIIFISPEFSRTILYPQQKTISLAEGEYEIQVQIYKNVSLTLGSTIQEQCVDVPRSGIGGFIGLTEKECYKINLPEQTITNALSGGGKDEVYVLESTLENSNSIVIDVESFLKPVTINQLQDNYNLLEEKGANIYFQ